MQESFILSQGPEHAFANAPARTWKQMISMMYTYYTFRRYTSCPFIQAVPKIFSKPPPLSSAHDAIHTPGELVVEQSN